jgi:DNA-binding PadR family transcriptional regulator
MPRSWKTDSLAIPEAPTRLGRGDVKLLLLAALEEGAKHGYELMKAVEQLSAGRYIPSAGVVYPTLKLFSEQGLLKVEPGGDRRRYALTLTGKKHLVQKREALALALKRLRSSGDGVRPDVRALSQEAQKVLRELFAKPAELKPAQVVVLRKLLAETSARIKRVLE